MYSEHEILEGLKSRDEKVIKEFYERHKAKAFSVLYNYGVGENECLTIYNDAVVSLIDNVSRNKYKGQSALSTYLIGIAKFMCFKKFKKDEKSALVLSGEDMDYELEDEDQSELDNSRIEKASKALKSIDEVCRNLLIRFYYEGISLTKLADDLGYTKSFIRVKKVRCLKKVKDIINK